jgi:hypothetical protein
LKNEISQAKEETKEDDEPRKNIAELRESYVNLKIHLEEAKRREEVVRNQLDKKEPKKFDAGPSFIKDENMSKTTPSFVKIEIRYDSGSSRSKNKRNTTKFRRSDQGRHLEAIHIPQIKFIRETPSWMNQIRYESVFNGYCFSCNDYGHKALDCRHHGRKQVGRFNNNIRCWNCNHVGHIVAHCYTMRCYSCDGYGHKAYNYCNSRKQSMRNTSYSMTKGVNGTWKKNEVPVIDDQRTKFKKPGHSQMWIEKTEQVNRSEFDCYKKNCSHVKSIV